MSNRGKSCHSYRDPSESENWEGILYHLSTVIFILITLISSKIRDIVNHNLRESHKHVLLSFINLIYLSSSKDIFSFLLERKRGRVWGERGVREREGDKLPSRKHPDRGANIQPGCVS